MPGNTVKSEDVQKIILALLVSQKDAVPLGHLDRDYKEQEGECIPWKELGYISLFDYLKSMPKYFHLDRINGMYYVRGIASDKSKHVSLLVARQKNLPKKPPYARRTYKPSCYYPKTQRPRIQLNSDILTDIIYTVRENPNGINREYILKRVREKLPYVNISIMDLEEQFKDLSHELFVQGNLVFPTKSKSRFTTEKSSESSEISTKREETLQSQNVTTTAKYCISGDSDSELNIDDDNDFSFVPNDDISNNHNENNRYTMSKKKQPISMFIQETVSKHHIQGDKLNEAFKYNTTENEQHYGQNNVTLDTFTERKYQDDMNCYIDDESPKLLINERTRFRLEKLIQKYPNGIWCAELPEKFLQEYDRSLNYIELGFNSVREFASYLPEIFQCKQLQPSGDFILYDAKHTLTDGKQKDRIQSESMTEFSQFYQEEEEIEALPSIVSSDTSNKLMPDGVMVIGETVGQISVIDLESRLQPYVEVFVEEVFTPSLFWVQLRKKKKLFNKLMEDLHAFYEEKSALYKIPLLVIEKGLNCACVYNNQWHRGIIKQVKPDLQVTVMFYDYGTLKTYPPEAIFYLHRSFSYLPAQAIPCGLYNTKPCVGEQWSRGVTHEFAYRTTQRPLIATIVSTDPENNSMLVTLTDTMEEEDVHINDWLVQQNLALHGKMVRIRPRNFAYRYYLECKKYKNNIETNSIDCTNSKLSITKTLKKSISPQCLTKSSTLHDSCGSSKLVLSPSVSSNAYDNLSYNDLKKDIQISQKAKIGSIQSNNFRGHERLASILQKIMNKKQTSSSSSYETTPHNTQLHSETNVTYMKKDEPETVLEKIEKSNSTSPSMKCNDPIPIISQNNCFVKTQLQKQDNCSTNINHEDYLQKQDVNICIEQNRQKQENIPLPKKCFINAVNLSVESKFYYLDYDTMPDDNITIINDTSKLITKRTHKINLKTIEIGISEKILSTLRSSRNHANDECDINKLENVMNSSNQVQVVTTDFQQNGSSDNKTIIPDIQKLDITDINENENYKFNDDSTKSSNMSKEECILSNVVEKQILDITDINENENYKFNDDSTKSSNMSKEECILSNVVEKHELTSHNNIDSNGTSVSIYDGYSTNLKNSSHWFETYNTLLKIYNTSNDDSKLDSDDLSNLDSSISTFEIDTKVSSSTSNMSLDSTNEEKSNSIDNTDANASSLTGTCDLQSSIENEDDKTKEQMKFDETVNMNPDEEVILSYNDNEVDSDCNEWDVVGDMHDFFANYFLPNVKMSNMVKDDNEEGVQITEINDNEEHDINNIESETFETKMIKNDIETLLYSTNTKRQSNACEHRY